jgi:hypothetical protein
MAFSISERLRLRLADVLAVPNRRALIGERARREPDKRDGGGRSAAKAD